jgi:transposase-like protein|tara:strand:+ start:126 stop:1394 length:1269 start_codon:yes stop_codon:yes gene_type:complete
MKSLLRVSNGNKKKRSQAVKIPSRSEVRDMEISSKVEFISSLIPLGLMAISEELERELFYLTGEKYSRKGGVPGNVRYGSNPGTVFLGGRKVPIEVPRVRNQLSNEEVGLKNYQSFHNHSRKINDLLFRRVLYGLSCKNYESAAESIPGTFGLSSSSVSRQFIKASASKLKEFQGRDLSGEDIVAMFVDGKGFAEDEMILAVGVKMGGEKVVLGFIQSSTENEKAISSLFKDLVSRGLNINKGILIVIDGAKGIHAAVRKVFVNKGVIQRCQWHKRENVVSYLPKTSQDLMRKRLQRAYSRPTYQEARKELIKIGEELSNSNQSALRSLEEGFEETLTLHRLGLFGILGESLKTTNCIESINSMIENQCSKVDYWKNSSQKQRWLASTIIDIEPRLRRIKGFRELQKLREALKKEIPLKKKT